MKKQNSLPTIDSYPSETTSCRAGRRQVQVGQTLLEMLLAFSISILALTGIILGVITSLNNTEYAKNQGLANTYAQEGMAVIRQIKESSWSNFSGNYTTNTTYCLGQNPMELKELILPNLNCWTQSPIPAGGIFSREVKFVHQSPRCCSDNTQTCDIVDSGTEVAVIVSWADSKCPVGNPRCHKVELITCFSSTSFIASIPVPTIIPTPTSVSLTPTPTPASGGLFSFGWSYRKSVTLSRPSGAVANYQMKLTVHYGSGTDSGVNVYCASHCKSDFSDLRFTNSDGITLLSYWIESYTASDNAVVWVKFDSIGTTATTFYMYYGNASATTASSGQNTFIMFDDFESLSNGDINGQDGWLTSGTGTATVETSIVKNGSKALQTYTATKTTMTAYRNWAANYKNYEVSVYIRTNVDGPTSKHGTPCYTYDIAAAQGDVMNWMMSYPKFMYHNGTAWTSYTTSTIWAKDTWYKVTTWAKDTNVQDIWINDVVKDTGHHIRNNFVNGSNRAYLGAWNSDVDIPQSFYYDDIIIRQRMVTEPTWGSWSS